MKKGFTMIEVLVVVLVFSVIAILATQSVLLSLRGSRRSESTIGVRENINYAIAIIERQLHNAESVNCPSATTISYTDELSQPADFTCDPAPGTGTLASSSAQLTSNEVRITACSFSCSVGSPGVPDSVTISITAQDADSTGFEGSQFTTNTRIQLRTY